MSTRLHSYGKIYNLGHKAVENIFKFGDVQIEEKVDGSQFSFGMVEDEDAIALGEEFPFRLLMRSKEADIDPENPPKLFAPAVESVINAFKANLLLVGVTYRGEAFQKPKHNTLAYDRVPKGNVMLFDLDMGVEDYESPVRREQEAARLGMEAIPVLWQGPGSEVTPDLLRSLLDRDSVLGGQKIEGVVIKAYGLFCKDGKTMMGKFVSEAYKETHRGDWKERNPGGRDIVRQIIDSLKTPARWEKAIQHLRDRGVLQNAPQDIGPLLKEIQIDTLGEEGEAIKERLMKWAWKEIAGGITRGFPQWYKERLLEQQFAPTQTTWVEREHVDLPNEGHF